MFVKNWFDFWKDEKLTLEAVTCFAELCYLYGEKNEIEKQIKNLDEKLNS